MTTAASPSAAAAKSDDLKAVGGVRSQYDCFDDDDENLIFCSMLRFGGACATDDGQRCKASCDFCELDLYAAILKSKVGCLLMIICNVTYLYI